MWHQLFGVFVIVVVGSCVRPDTEEDGIEISLRRGLEDYMKTGEASHELQRTMQMLQFPGLFSRTENKSIQSALICMACNVGIDVLIGARRLGASRKLLADTAITICTLAKITTKEICTGIINHHADSLLYIFDHKKQITSKRVCSILLQSKGCKDKDRQDWAIEIPPPVERDDYPLNKSPSKSTPLKVLHSSDIHYDPFYEVGSNADCSDPLCCLPGTVPKTPDGAAGAWGDYRGCDTPKRVAENYFKHIATQHNDLDYIYFTGDIVDHRVWGTGIEINTEVIKYITEEFKKAFGSTLVFPILGNHEPHPVNVFSDNITDTTLSTQWVYNLVAKEWTYWLPQDTRETILRGGFYTVLVRPGFRVIALNSNVCFTYNWWLFYSDVDPYGQLQWLVGVLSEAERNGEAVHILSHVPTADHHCLKNWAVEYSKIVNRFHNTIVAQFNGHTHHDQNIVYFSDEDPSKPTSVAFNGGSLTTYENVNPNYIVYDIDTETYEVLDYDSWIFNVTDANLTPDLDPVWYKLYSFKEAYGAENLRPSGMVKWAESIARSPALAQQYYRFKYRESEPALRLGCNEDCIVNNLCYTVTPYYEHNIHCEKIKEIWNSQRYGY